MITPGTKLDKLPRISKKYADILKRLHVETIEDLLFHFPFRYEDYSQRIPIANVQKGENATVMGEVISCKLTRTWKKKMLIVECHINDGSGTIRAVWFNQPYISDSLREGKGVRFSGKISSDKNGLYFSNPAWELSSRTPTNTGRLVPVYPETEGLTSRWLRWQIQIIMKLDVIPEDPIPLHILDQLHLPKLSVALNYIHFPKTENQYLLAQKRFAFQNMLLIQLAALQVKMQWQKEQAVIIKSDKKFIETFFKSLPFTLTNAQKNACADIFADLEIGKPMNRLLNGDVGSGKTIVAASASIAAVRAGYQATLMAPTEVLARQHFENMQKLFTNFSFSIGLLTNAYKIIFENGIAKETTREDILSGMKSGKLSFIIGTHALIQKDIAFQKLALIIIDEQHRFGVQQRAFLQQKAGEMNDGIKGKIPHFLTMTATPIPRTLTLAFFGNLDLSVLDEMPKNRKPIATEIVQKSRREEIYEFIRQEISSGHQAFVILPLVEESKALSEVKAATQEHSRLSKHVFPNLNIGLLHGKLKSQEKEAVMMDFKEKKYDILVATSVVEVGIDVPNATVIIIEDADRFGLSQLHQFRGRVGRGAHQSYCFLFSKTTTEKGRSRLKALAKTTDGFKIAEYDLKLRGPGEFFGSRQSGIPDIAMQHIANVKLIDISRKYAQQILDQDNDLKKHPNLRNKLKNFGQKVHLE